MLEFHIYFSDLDVETQLSILDFYDISTPEEANLDTLPIATLYAPD